LLPAEGGKLKLTKDSSEIPPHLFAKLVRANLANKSVQRAAGLI
jgi:hypothetical protein